MKKRITRPPQLDEIFPKIRDCITNGRYRQSIHAMERKLERNIDLPDILYVLINGYHEKQKTSFDEVFQTWKYAIRGRTLDKNDIRIIIAFDDDMLIITVMHC
jgi:hypothetical protein